MKSRHAMVLTALVFAYGPTANADSFESCAAEKDDAARLACYDRIANSTAAAEAAAEQAERQAQAESAEAARAAEEAAAAEAAMAAKAAEAEAAAKAAEAEAAARAAEAEMVAMAAEEDAAAKAAEAEAAARAAAEEEFGMTRDLEKKLPPEERSDRNELRELDMAVIEVRHRPSGEHIVTLENGQVWVEKRAIYGFRVEVGDTVKLKKGSFGGYTMVGRGRRSSQVRRVE